MASVGRLTAEKERAVEDGERRNKEMESAVKGLTEELRRVRGASRKDISAAKGVSTAATDLHGVEPSECKDLREKLESLRVEEGLLRAGKEGAEKELNRVRGELERAEREWERDREACNRANSECKNSQEQVAKLQRDLEGKDARIHHLSMELQSQTSSPTTGESARCAGDCSEKVSSLSSRLLELREKLDSSKVDNLALRGRLNASENRCREMELTAKWEAESIARTREEDQRMRQKNRRGRKVPFGAPLGSSSSSSRPSQGATLLEFLDSVSLSFSSALKSNLYLRAAFLGYLLLLHFWAAVVLAIKANSFEAEHADFGSYRHFEQQGG